MSVSYFGTQTLYGSITVMQDMRRYWLINETLDKVKIYCYTGITKCNNTIIIVNTNVCTLALLLQ